ncbi:HsdM family class I SAM-dependent methyltransferase [Dyadobacter psychrotolerans]|uniref:site-specific DNA-methyltransferase (adenine-specific) n=1 Tax=Dyadobacter psychrotolerans TaxID=2541721 RepID=A0A4R5DXZ6_9BACT|nr:N-6 DNA methylase [Dyadobacter psychrotolerans]TDE17574.1 N-6 DNA methylase [Dyadobacter psychrotolerans]
MGSQTRVYNKQKLLGQIYTPLHIVEKILEDSGFYSMNLTESLILDPACGDGRFLIPIAKYIIENIPENDIEACLKNLHGWDIDSEALELCRKNMDALTENLGFRVSWNLHSKDALHQINSRTKFHLIVGNPPYIRIQHLPASQRKYVRSFYSFCSSGSTDAYVAFFQLASVLLAEDGICGFITPNSFLTSQTARPLRLYFSQNQNLKQITNYGSVKVFGNTGTYAVITIFGRASAEKFRYELSDQEFAYSSREIPFSEITEQEKWQLSVDFTPKTDGIRLGDLCQISVGVTTLSDGLYLFTIVEDSGEFVEVVSKAGWNVKLEKHILKPIVKGSKLKTASDSIKEYILFPYQKDDRGKHKIMPEGKLQSEYPLAYSYLTSIKSQLDKRDNGKPNAVAWYAFGRAQGLDTSFGKKIIFSPMNRFPKFVLYENEECTVYSGYFIKYDGAYEPLLRQLNSQRMAEFIGTAGRDFQGGYKGYNKKVVENFIITDLSKEN